MDRVRFGRALGVGARAAAKSLLSAAEAAAAPAPEPTRRPQQPPSPRATSTTPPARPAIPDPRVIRTQATQLKRSVWSPFARFSSVLWLEVTGFFFAIFAVIAAQQVFRNRAAFRLAPSSTEAQHLYVYLGLLAVFGYFAVSSFVRANRRQRR